MVTIEITGNVTEDYAEEEAEEYVMKNDAWKVLCTGWRIKADAEKTAEEGPGNDRE
ncbi:hypothetical protein AGMMS49991_04680 [Spirochaetia bacterium]|nr:hypothetical protein AGMMS49991_04680 [Spirochaetia bacterium]